MHTPSTTSHYAVVAHELHVRTYLHCSSLRSVDCSPTCKNGGTCVTSFWYSPRCVCPSGYTGSYCQESGTYSHTTRKFKELMILESYTVICINLQPVVPPVEMEERVVVHLSMLTVAVAVGTQDPTASTNVCTYIRICKSRSMYCTYVYSSIQCTYLCS